MSWPLHFKHGKLHIFKDSLYDRNLCLSVCNFIRCDGASPSLPSPIIGLYIQLWASEKINDNMEHLSVAT